MPNRILKGSIYTSETIDQLSVEVERCFYRLLVQSDDYGCFDGSLGIIRAACVPLRTDVITLEDVSGWRQELEDADLIWRYTVQGRPCLQFTKWRDHQQQRTQRLKHPEPSAIPGPVDAVDKSSVTHLISDDIRCNPPLSDDIRCPDESQSESAAAAAVDYVLPLLRRTKLKGTASNAEIQIGIRQNPSPLGPLSAVHAQRFGLRSGLATPGERVRETAWDGPWASFLWWRRWLGCCGWPLKRAIGREPNGSTNRDGEIGECCPAGPGVLGPGWPNRRAGDSLRGPGCFRGCIGLEWRDLWARLCGGFGRIRDERGDG